MTGLGNSAPILYDPAGVISTRINLSDKANTLLVSQLIPIAGAAGHGVELHFGSAADTVNVRATSSNFSYFIDGGNGADFVNVGSAAPALTGNLTGINGQVFVTSGFGRPVVKVDASTDAAPRSATLDSPTTTDVRLSRSWERGPDHFRHLQGVRRHVQDEQPRRTR